MEIQNNPWPTAFCILPAAICLKLKYILIWSVDSVINAN